MSNLLPDDVLADLDQQFGATFEACSPLERLALVTAKAEGCITHRRLLELTREHPADLTSALHDLVERDLLEQDGRGKGTFYFLPGEHPIQDALFGAPPELPLNSEHLPEDSEQWRNLKNLAQPVSATGKAPREAVEAILLQLCREQCLNLEQLARLLSRKRDSLRNNYINPMVDRGLLDPKHPNIRNHPKQKYRTV
jgi:ATP-dependent DNA helicase RecG